jgi:hypothetical protein
MKNVKRMQKVLEELEKIFVDDTHEDYSPAEICAIIEIGLGKKLTEWDEDLNICLDGNAWCATRDGFINLQESPAGFGDTLRETIEDLRKKESQDD